MKRIKLLYPGLGIAAVIALAIWWWPADKTKQDKAASGQEAQLSPEEDSIARAKEKEALELEARQEATLRENARPQEFIRLEFEHRKNLLGESVIEGKMFNNAQYTQYRDFQLMIYFLDAEGGILDSASQVVFTDLSPGGGSGFRVKDKGPKGTREVRVQVRDAKVVEGI